MMHQFGSSATRVDFTPAKSVTQENGCISSIEVWPSIVSAAPGATEMVTGAMPGLTGFIATFRLLEELAKEVEVQLQVQDKVSGDAFSDQNTHYKVSDCCPDRDSRLPLRSGRSGCSGKPPRSDRRGR